MGGGSFNYTNDNLSSEMFNCLSPSCGWSLEKFSLFYDYYAYFDTRDYLADAC